MRPKPPSSVLPFAEAARVWELYGFSRPADLVLEDLALAMGVLVLDDRLEGADARLVRNGERGLVRVKKDIPELGRRRFAIAHELGHWRLHAKLSQILACTSEDMVKKYQASEAEVEANYFASALLMPEKLYSSKIRGVQPTMELMTELAGFFNTTLTATTMRLTEVTTEACAVIVSENGRIRWWRLSESLEKGTWVEAGPVPSGSRAAALFRGEPNRGPLEADASDWLRADDELELETLIEDSVLLGRYGSVVTLLWAS